MWIAVLTMPEIPGGNIEAYAVKVFESWTLGEKGTDQGVLLVLGVNDRQIRIEVGYGLEGDLTDAAAIHIIDDYMVPHFKDGAWGSGIQSGILGIAKQLSIELGSAAPPQNLSNPWFTTYFGPNTFGRKVFLFMLCTVLIVTLALELSQIRDGTWTLAGIYKRVLGMLSAFGFLGCFLGLGFYAGLENGENMFFIVPGIFYLLFFWHTVYPGNAKNNLTKSLQEIRRKSKEKQYQSRWFKW